MKKLLTALALSVVLALSTASPFGGVSVSAQATITRTTLTADVTSTANVIAVTSATGFVKGYTIVIDNEQMTIQQSYVSGLVIPVSRGAGGAQGRHSSGAAVWVAQSAYFSTIDPDGPCTSTEQIALPRIVIGGLATTPPLVSIYDCLGKSATTQRWQLLQKNGYPAATFGLLPSPTGAVVTYTTATAIIPQPGIIQLNGSTLGMTLTSPSRQMDGTIMVIQALNASAHTVTYTTTGFNGQGSSADVATYGGAIGDNLVLFANGGVWWVISSRNVTLG